MTPLEFARIKAGTFTMGAMDAPHPEDGEGPARPVVLPAFEITRHAITTAQFAQFVTETGYKTLAETRGASHVFYLHLAQPESHATPLADAPWWRDVQDACWHTPNGETKAQPDHPVVHVAYADAQAYCAWRGVRLPTEAEWECAAQGSDLRALNVWQGDFPNAPIGIPGTRPVDDGTPNAQGLIHACGNTWEWTGDGFGRLHSPREARNPSGHLGARDKVVKGGSYLCAPSYCARFRPSSRRPEHPAASTGHLGFRVVKL